METHPPPVRVNIYLDDPSLKRSIKIAAAHRGVTLSAYCVEAIRQRLTREEFKPDPDETSTTQNVVRAMDRLRSEIGPLGIPVRDLIDEGHRG
jgi:hypothetical protein